MPRWFRRLLFRLKERLMGRDTFALLPELLANQYLPPAELADRQWAAAQRIVRFAFEHVPYYHARWAGLDLEAILSDPARWAELPILTKADVRAAGETLVAPDVPGRLVRATTSGSTHRMLAFRSDVRRAGWSGAARLRAWRWWGLDYGAVDTHLRLRLWGRALSRRQRALERLRRLGMRLAGARHVDGNAALAAGLMDHVATLRRDNPEVIVTYGSLLGHLGFTLQRLATRLPLPRLKAAVYISDAISPAGRAAAEEALGAPVVCEYGCREFGLIAFQCPEGRLHIAEDTLWLEVVDDAGRPVPDGEPGQVLLTDLRPSRTPFVRYAISDVAALAPRTSPSGGEACPCGVTLRQLARFEGRTSEMIRRPDGSQMHPTALEAICRPLPGVRCWQVRLTPPDRLRLLIEMPAEALAPWHEGLLRQLRAYAGPGFACTVVAVEAIAPLPNGKMPPVVIEEEG